MLSNELTLLLAPVILFIYFGTFSSVFLCVEVAPSANLQSLEGDEGKKMFGRNAGGENRRVSVGNSGPHSITERT